MKKSLNNDERSEIIAKNLERFKHERIRVTSRLQTLTRLRQKLEERVKSGKFEEEREILNEVLEKTQSYSQIIKHHAYVFYRKCSVIYNIVHKIFSNFTSIIFV